MSTINELLRQKEAELAKAAKRRKAFSAEGMVLVQTAERQAREQLTAQEKARADFLVEEMDKEEERIRALKGDLEELRAADEEERDIERQSRSTRDWAPKRNSERRTASLSVGRNEHTYSPDEDPDGQKFLLDVARGQIWNDPAANERLARHQHEMTVDGYSTRAAGDLTTGAVTGLVVPQYLTDLVAPAVSARRPFADVCNGRALPREGMSVNISRITTATSAALQAVELTAVSATSMDDTLLTVPVQTAAGQQVVSRQALERGVVEPTVVGDLMARVATVVDSTLINQATTGLSAVAQSTTYDDTTPTAPELYPKVLAAFNNVETALLGLNADIVVMHPRRWNWLSKEMTNTWPMINSQGIPTQASGVSNAQDYGSGFRGRLPNGMAVIVDANVPVNLGVGTNQDEIYVVPRLECFLWEELNSPVMIRAEASAAAGSLGVLFVAYEFFGYTFARYTNGMAKVAGTGLVTPVF